MSDNNSKNNKLDPAYALNLLDHNFKLIQHAETKASIVLGIVGVTLTITATVYNQIPNSYWVQLFLMLFIVSCIISAVFTLFTIKAKIGFKEPENHLYFLYVTKQNRQAYVYKIMTMSEKEKVTDILNEVYTLAHIQLIKYHRANMAVSIFVLALFFLALSGIFTLWK